MRRILQLLLTTMLAAPSWAADMASDLRSGGDGPDIGDGWYAEVGLVATVSEGSRRYDRNGDQMDASGTGLALVFNGEFRYRGLFAEAAWGSLDGLNLGYNFWNNDYWTLDLLASSGHGRGVDSDNPDIGHLPEDERNLELKKRVYSFRGSGIRVTGYFGNYIFQYRLLVDHFNDTGVISTARLGRSWQVGNWNLHGLGSLRWDSAKTNQEAFGITAEEATTQFPEYRPGAGFSYAAEVGATYPLSQNWVFRTTAQVSTSEKAGDSPLRRKTGAFINASLTYVFGE